MPRANSALAVYTNYVWYFTGDKLGLFSSNWWYRALLNDSAILQAAWVSLRDGEVLVGLAVREQALDIDDGRQCPGETGLR